MKRARERERETKKIRIDIGKSALYLYLDSLKGNTIIEVAFLRQEICTEGFWKFITWIFCFSNFHVTDLRAEIGYIIL